MTETLSGKLVSEHITTVIKLPYLTLRSAATDLLFDRRYGVRTAGRIEPGELGITGTPPWVLTGRVDEPTSDPPATGGDRS